MAEYRAFFFLLLLFLLAVSVVKNICGIFLFIFLFHCFRCVFLCFVCLWGFAANLKKKKKNYFYEPWYIPVFQFFSRTNDMNLCPFVVRYGVLNVLIRAGRPVFISWHACRRSVSGTRTHLITRRFVFSRCSFVLFFILCKQRRIKITI